MHTGSDKAETDRRDLAKDKPGEHCDQHCPGFIVLTSEGVRAASGRQNSESHLKEFLIKLAVSN